MIEAAIREQDVIPEATVTVQAGIDGVMVPQDGEHAKPRGRHTDTPEPPRHGVVASGPAEHDAARHGPACFRGRPKRRKEATLNLP